MGYYAKYDSPVGVLLLTAEEDALTGLWMDKQPPAKAVPKKDHPILMQAAAWLDAYFRGQILPVDIPLRPEGTAFQMQVWEMLRAIPYGKTRSYGEIAREMAVILGKERMSAQAVGNAVGNNPISILIPCHRVVGAKGQLTGYAGGLDKKVWLLVREGQTIKNNKVL